MSINNTRRHDPAPQIADGIHVCGISYRDTPVEVREAFAVPPAGHNIWLRQVLAHPDIAEAVVVSTCNRTEIVVAACGSAKSVVFRHLEAVYADLSKLPRNDFSRQLYTHSDAAAVQHVFRVAAGLDSMVVGEPQVLGQIKTAFHSAADAGATRSLLNGLFQRAFAAAKLVRTETAIGQNAVSVCYAAKELALQIFGDLKPATVMMLGTGDTGQLALKYFGAAGAERFIIASRSLQRAADVAELFGGVALEISSHSVPDFLAQADIVVGATQNEIGSDPILPADLVSQAQRVRRGRPQFFIDLGVPRNLDSKIADLSDVFLYDIDDLGAVIAENIDKRALEVKRAEVLIGGEVQGFMHWLERRKASGPIHQAQMRLEQYRREELARTSKRLRKLGVSEEQCDLILPALEDLTEALTAKVMHQPLSRLARELPERAEVLAAFKDFFVNADLPESQRRKPPKKRNSD